MFMNFTISLSRLAILQNRAKSKRSELLREISPFVSATFDEILKDGFEDKLNANYEKINQDLEIIAALEVFISNAKLLRFRKNLETGVSNLINQIEYLKMSEATLHDIILENKRGLSVSPRENFKDVKKRLSDDLQFAKDATERKACTAQSVLFNCISAEQFETFERTAKAYEKQQLKLSDEIAEINAKTKVEIEVNEKLAEILGL